MITPPDPLFIKEGEQELFDERAAIMEFDGGMSREEAERKAGEMVRGMRKHGR